MPTTSTTQKAVIEHTVEIDVNEIDDFDLLEEEVLKKTAEAATLLMVKSLKKNKRFWWRGLYWKIRSFLEMAKRRFKLKA